jgi:hypothetical protein
MYKDDENKKRASEMRPFFIVQKTEQNERRIIEKK